MRHLTTFLVLIILANTSFAKRQMTISLITDPGVKATEYLQFSILNSTSTTHEFTFDKFSKDGNYGNLNLFQYSEDIDTGLHIVNITLKGQKGQNIIDTLRIDGTTIRIKLFILVSTTESTGDFIKEIKTLSFKAHSENLTFSLFSKPKIGTKAVFNIQNMGDKDVYGYPNSAFFFGTLYEKIREHSWIQHYPHYISIKYCDTIARARPLTKGQKTNAWTPNANDCSEYVFQKKGDYYFELLYTLTDSLATVMQGLTRIIKADVYRQVFEFKI